jgi:hypothetical protein
MYQCGNSACNKVFIHTAKLSEYTPTTEAPLAITNALESSVCPFCKSKAYTEVAEEKVSGSINLADVASLIDCPPSEADMHLKEGYVLFQTWQKNVFLVKLKLKVAPVDAKPTEASP